MKSIFTKDLFLHKICLITGGGSGIGLCTAKEAAQLGARVIITGRKESKLQQAAASIQEAGGDCQFYICNNRKPEEVDSMLDQVMQKYGRIDYLVNNAGGQFPAPAERIKPKGFHAVLETNLSSTFFLMQKVFDCCFQEKGGAIVNVLMNNRNGFPMMSHSAAARAGVENLTKTLAVEWGRCGIRINSVSPGIIKSSGLNTYAEEFQEAIYAAAKYNQSYRLGKEEEISSAILFLLSPGANYMTGQNIYVDAGENLYSPLYPPKKPTNWPE